MINRLGAEALVRQVFDWVAQSGMILNTAEVTSRTSMTMNTVTTRDELPDMNWT